MKHIYYLVLTLSITLQTLDAGCGGCGPAKTTSSKEVGLIESIPTNKHIAGNVLISCGMCNFMSDDNDCSLAIKIGKNILSVNDVGINEHGDSHARDGYCNVIKKVYVEGKVNNLTFYPEKIELPSI